MLKCQLHIHTEGDSIHRIPFTPKELILHAKNLNYEVLAITCHNTIIFDDELKNYAASHGILLIPGVELAIRKKHVVILNPDKDVLKVNSFKALREYKSSHPDCLIMAPHPFYPGLNCLHKHLTNNTDIFDAIEFSFCYTKKTTFNTKAEKFATAHSKPLITTSDCHFLELFDYSHCFIDAKKTIPAVFDAIKQNRIKNVSTPLTHRQIAKIVLWQKWVDFGFGKK